MQLSKKRFIEQALKKKALQFGRFTLKSGRLSPYFFNMGALDDGESLMLIGELYAEALIKAKLTFDQLFGPAYKGLPLATATAIALAKKGFNYPLSFNRKEAKTHGEGGLIIGAALRGNILVIDDVLTAGTAFKQSKELIERHGARVSGLLIALDRMEALEGKLSAVQVIKQQYNIPVLSLITFDDLTAYLSETHETAILHQLKEYRQCYGAS